MTTINGIKPCPLCESKEFKEYTSAANNKCVVCNSCGFFDTTLSWQGNDERMVKRIRFLEDAIEAWNKRYTPPSMTVTTSLRGDEPAEDAIRRVRGGNKNEIQD